MAAVDLKSLDKQNMEKFLESFDIVLSDCDGVLWRETDVINGSPEAVNKLKQLGKKFFFVTNNNGNTRLELVKKCKNFGYNAVTEEILCTSYLAAVYLKEKNFQKKVYIVGSEGIAQELDAQGIKHFGVGPDVMIGNELDIHKSFEPDPDVGAVIVGFDKHFSYPKLVKAATYAQMPGVHFLGTNPDLQRPSPYKTRYPGAGCFLLAIEAAAGKKAVILGKPETFISEIIKQKFHVNPSRTLMIGDNLNTDILLGKRCGYLTLMVLSGITSQEDLEVLKNSNSSILPDFWTNQLSDLHACLNTLS
ncbi:PREDICTED: phosphoglycolate phosphatase [Ceratosolen solmsi marchali]|uniref:Phosphoglycolate phosphatase n=1 Tax=Ceratosolen solmsi marchali TaxID=326594 RepID=A0AAJ7DZG4_9HYME|nr:PREDICTED: phosphoglycolate phosphatase [Ceratosolen solmsi marchali]